MSSYTSTLSMSRFFGWPCVYHNVCTSTMYYYWTRD